MKNTNIDTVRRAAAQARREDIEAHGKATAFRTHVAASKKAYSRKHKHKKQQEDF